MPAPGEDLRGLQSARTAANDEPAPLRVGRKQRPKTPVSTRDRVDRAADRETAIKAVDTRLVAANAVNDLVFAPLRRLAGPVRVGQQRARNRNDIGLAVRDDRGGLHRILEATTDEHY